MTFVKAVAGGRYCSPSVGGTGAGGIVHPSRRALGMGGVALAYGGGAEHKKNPLCSVVYRAETATTDRPRTKQQDFVLYTVGA